MFFTPHKPKKKKAGKLPKKPRRPKVSASVTSWKKFDERYRAWLKKCSDIKNAKKHKESLIKKYSHHY